jgi:hypothetical protein
MPSKADFCLAPLAAIGRSLAFHNRHQSASNGESARKMNALYFSTFSVGDMPTEAR